MFSVSYAESRLSSKFELNTAIFIFLTDFRSAKNPIFSQLVPQTSNCAFCVSYAEGSLTFKFQLNTPDFLILTDFEVKKVRFLATRPTNLKLCVLCYLR